MRQANGVLSSTQVTIVGTGPVGRTLGVWLAARGARVRAIASRNRAHAERAARELDAVAVPLEAVDSGSDDVLLLAVPSSALPELAAQLGGREQAPIALHTAGDVGAEAIAALAAAGSECGALHPLRAFSGVIPIERAPGTFYAVDGSEPAARAAEAWAEAWQGTSARIDGSQRLLYHLAATVAAGGVATLVTAATSLAEEAGIDRSILRGYAHLARHAIEDVERSEPPAAAITGPATRGDVELVARQHDVLAQGHPDWADLFASLIERTLAERERVGRPVERAEEIRARLRRS